MTIKTESVAKITATAITVLSRELGVVNTARFLINSAQRLVITRLSGIKFWVMQR